MRIAPPGRSTLVGLGVVALSALVYWLCNKGFDAGRADFFFLAKAFLEGRTWLDFRPGLNDVIVIDSRIYVPFAPFPAIVFMPLAAIFDPRTLDVWESGIDATIAAIDVGLCWMLMGRLGVVRLWHRFWLVVLLGFSTALWNVTTRGGVWHEGHLIATALTLGCLIELWGRQRAWLIGLLAGLAFLTRAPLAFAVPFYALMLDSPGEIRLPQTAGGFISRLVREFPIRRWIEMAAAFSISIAFFFWYNAARFGNPLESGYALASLPPFLEIQRQQGLFSLSHVGMNVSYLFTKIPRVNATFPFLHADGLGMSVFLTSPGLLLAAFAPWRSSRSWWLAAAALFVLVPTLLYYGGGWYQFGYRYFIDSIPFLVALCGLAVAKSGRLSWTWIAIIIFGVVVNALGVAWNYYG
jgi:hypothetical protein